MEGTERQLGGRMGGTRQPVLRYRSTNRQTVVLLRDARGVHGARGALDGLWTREPRRNGVEPTCSGANDDEVVPPRDAG